MSLSLQSLRMVHEIKKKKSGKMYLTKFIKTLSATKLLLTNTNAEEVKDLNA